MITVLLVDRTVVQIYIYIYIIYIYISWRRNVRHTVPLDVASGAAAAYTRYNIAAGTYSLNHRNLTSTWIVKRAAQPVAPVVQLVTSKPSDVGT